MDKEKLIMCKNKSDVCRLLKIAPNGKGMKKVDEILIKNDLPLNFFKQKIKLFCKNCGKEIIRKDGKSVSGRKFCSKTCSAIFNNKNRIITDEHKKNICNGLKKYYNNNYDEK